MTTPRVTVPVEPTEAMRLVPDRVLTETLYWMARAYERVHSMPRVSDTELANKIEAAKADLGRARDASPILSNSAAPAPEGGAADGPWTWLTAYVEGDGDPADREYNCDDMVAAWRAGYAALATREVSR